MKIILSILLCGISFYAKSQVGFLGKKNELSIDTFDPLYQSSIKVDYKRSVREHVALYFGFRQMNPSENIIMSNDYRNTHNLTEMLSNFKYTYIGQTYCLGYIGNSTIANLAMPLGYYMGLAFEAHFGELTQSYLIQDYQGNSNLLVDTFDNFSFKIKWMMGRDVLVYGPLTLDLNFEFGYTFGSYASLSSNDELFPFLVYPVNLIFYHTQHAFDINYFESNNYVDGIKKSSFTYIQFYLQPSIKLGFLF